MDLLFRHKQEKKEKRNSSFCDTHVTHDGVNLNLTMNFIFHYVGLVTKKDAKIQFTHSLTINTDNGNIDSLYRLVNDNVVEQKYYKTCEIKKRNSFKHIHDSIWDGFERGEKRIGYWGTQYKKASDNIFKIFKTVLFTKFTPPPHKDEKDYSDLYELLVDFHLYKKEIKGHNHIYDHIMYHYPKKKWLIKNKNKYVPAVLDSMGIKSGYLISEINKTDKQIKLAAVNYLCKLFGENYVDYIKETPWIQHCFAHLPSKLKFYTLKNEYEKKQLFGLIKKWEDDIETLDGLIYSLYEIFKVREYLDKHNIETKFTANTQIKFNLLKEQWIGLKEHNSRGYKNRYVFPQEFIKEIEEKIVTKDKTYLVKILKSEDDFRVEGATMKNCMATQFIHGSNYIYISMSSGKTKINLQYRKGELVQALSKTNKPISNEYLLGVDILTKKMDKYKDITWKKERYDFLQVKKFS